MRIVSGATSTARHGLAATAEALLVAGIIATLVLALAPFYKPAGSLIGDTAAGRLTGVLTVPDGAFAGTTTATANPGGSKAWVRIRCRNDGGVALEAWRRVDGNNQATFTLGPTPSWSGGGASCEAWEGYYARNGAFRVIAYTTFMVSG